MYVVLNPHISDFISKPLSSHLFKRRALKKYGYIIDEALANEGSVTVLANSAASGLVPMSIFKKLPYFLRYLITRFEIGRWKKINGFNDQVQVYYNADKLPDRKALVMLSYKNYQNPVPALVTCNAFELVIAHISHYHLFTSQQSAFLSGIRNLVIAADSDISTTPYFREKFSWYERSVFILPFEITARFKRTKQVRERQVKILATGTFHFFDRMIENGDVSAEEFCKANNTGTMHPIRREIFEHKEEVSAWMDPMVSPYNDGELRKSLLQRFFSTTFTSQKKYFSFDIVAGYNDHRFAVVGEEYFSGLPGIGSFEAMGCGCVLIGVPECYKGLGMEPGIHYLAHNNTLEGIKTVFEANKDDLPLLESISEQGRTLIEDFFRPAVSYKRLRAFTDTAQQLHY